VDASAPPETTTAVVVTTLSDPAGVPLPPTDPLVLSDDSEARAWGEIVVGGLPRGFTLTRADALEVAGSVILDVAVEHGELGTIAATYNPRGSASVSAERTATSHTLPDGATVDLVRSATDRGLVIWTGRGGLITASIIPNRAITGGQELTDDALLALAQSMSAGR
jgi:hypothetical protein